jgi:hypothetical protein
MPSVGLIYTDIINYTYIPILTVTEITTGEKCVFYYFTQCTRSTYISNTLRMPLLQPIAKPRHTEGNVLHELL